MIETAVILLLILATIPSVLIIFLSSHTGQLSLVILSWLGAVSTGNGYSHGWWKVAVTSVQQ